MKERENKKQIRSSRLVKRKYQASRNKKDGKSALDIEGRCEWMKGVEGKTGTAADTLLYIKGDKSLFYEACQRGFQDLRPYSLTFSTVS